MSRHLHLAAVALNQTPLDWAGNAARILAALKEAESRGVSFCCLPELCISGYGCEDAFFMPHALERSMQSLREIAEAAPAQMAFCVGLPVRLRHAIFNAVAVVVRRRVIGFVAKRFLASDGVHYEARWFRPWPEGEVATVDFGALEGKIPFGDLLFDVGGVRFGFEICEDAWVAARPGARLALRGADILLNPSASHFAFGKHTIRERFIAEGSRAFNTTYVYANLLGNESGRIVFDGGCYIATDGAIVARGPRLSLRDFEVVDQVIDLELTRTRHAMSASFQPQGTPVENEIVCSFDWPRLPILAPVEPEALPPMVVEEKFEEFTRAA